MSWAFFLNATKVDGVHPKMTTVRILLPHEILDALADHPLAFSSLLLGNLNMESRIQFWEHIRNLKPWSSHPELQENNRDGFKSLIPLTLHADGAQFYSEDEVFIWSISSLFGSMGIVTDILLQKFPFCLIPERYMRSDADPCHTVHQLFC